MNIFIVGILIFVISVSVIELIFYAYRGSPNSKRRDLKKRLKTFSPTSAKALNGLNSMNKKSVLSNAPFLNEILAIVPGAKTIDRLLKQANVQYNVDKFILFTFALALTAYMVCSLVVLNPVAPIIVAGVFAMMPFYYLRSKKKQRMEKFQRQLPDALDLIGRALRAGHAFTSGMKLAADEFDGPLGPEFDDTLDEINFGISVPEALTGLAKRIDCSDLKYFVISVILQRETGGNLSEIIETIAYLIRERYKLRGKIRVLSAEGKLTATILFALPWFVMIALSIINPDYIKTLINEPSGQIISGIALFMMILGALAMKKMVNIKI